MSNPVNPVTDEQKNMAQNIDSDVCVACATPPGASGLAVIRMSGEESSEIASRVFRSAAVHGGTVREMAGYTCRFGRIIDPIDQSLIDEVVLTRFVAPRSFTGEDLIEISCHGGSAVKRAILRVLCEAGARPAEPGEFSRRAFLNGKIDLSQAEAVMDLISASAGRTAAAAAKQLEGGLTRLVRSRIDEVYGLLARTELILEFPEHDDLTEAGAELAEHVRQAAVSLAQLGDTFRQGKVLHDGMTVVIAGRPNVGKSSLLNSLTGYDRAIVTEVPGTTRDTVEELIDIEGVPVRLIDTAGLRDTTDRVERIGIDRARSAIQQADLVFYLISPPWDPSAADEELDDIRLIAAERPLILLCGKSDLPEWETVSTLVREALPEVAQRSVSTVTGEGREAVRQSILESFQTLGVPGSEDILITNLRHWQLVTTASSRLQEASDALATGIPLDVSATLMRAAVDALAEITGDAVGEVLIETIFSRFCVGK